MHQSTDFQSFILTQTEALSGFYVSFDSVPEIVLVAMHTNNRWYGCCWACEYELFGMTCIHDFHKLVKSVRTNFWRKTFRMIDIGDSLGDRIIFFNSFKGMSLMYIWLAPLVYVFTCHDRTPCRWLKRVQIAYDRLWPARDGVSFVSLALLPSIEHSHAIDIAQPNSWTLWIIVIVTVPNPGT